MSKAILVTAIANGYYGGMVRVPGDKFAIEDASHFSERWMTSEDKSVGKRGEKVETPPVINTVNIGGTDGIVKAAVPADREGMSARDLIAAAKAATGRNDIRSKADAEAALAALDAQVSPNDDRSGDVASNPADDAPAPTDDDEPSADWEEPKPVEG